VKDRSTKEPQLNIRNWECGVIIPVAVTGGGANQTKANLDRSTSWKAFQTRVPVPMVVEGDDKVDSLLYGNERPWFFMGSA